jgi:hypothetical protein
MLMRPERSPGASHAVDTARRWKMPAGAEQGPDTGRGDTVWASDDGHLFRYRRHLSLRTQGAVYSVVLLIATCSWRAAPPPLTRQSCPQGQGDPSEERSVPYMPGLARTMSPMLSPRVASTMMSRPASPLGTVSIISRVAYSCIRAPLCPPRSVTSTAKACQNYATSKQKSSCDNAT